MKVTIYHTTNCAFCKTEMQWLDSKGVEYSHINIEEDEAGLQFIRDLQNGKQTVPVTTVKRGDVTHAVYGFDRKRLTEVLGL